MKHLSWEAKLGISLICFSFVVYFIKFVLLGDPQNTYFYIFNALGFLPINVLLVTLILNKMLTVKSKRERMEKINMVIGTYFSEVGTQLLAYLSDRDPNLHQVRSKFLVSGKWSDQEFDSMRNQLECYTYHVDIHKVDLPGLRCWLIEKRDFLLRILENPVLLEHETFTEMMRAVFHLTDELVQRKDMENLPESDLKHLEMDMNRAYRDAAVQWVAYMQYLKKKYPYLFHLALRLNPFDEDASPIVR